MKKILTIFFLVVVCLTLVFGQTVISQTKQELQRLYLECMNALAQFKRASILN